MNGALDLIGCDVNVELERMTRYHWNQEQEQQKLLECVTIHNLEQNIRGVKLSRMN
jgi:hypothetical protein